MAFVVRRPGGRWEIRESAATAEGPRAHTLVSFRRLTPEVIERAAAAARGPFDLREVLRSARRAGVGPEPARADALARALLREIARGATLSPGIHRLLHAGLSAATPDDALAPWMDATLQERGEALVDLLGLTDRLPKQRRAPLTFPGLSASRLRS